MSRLIISLCIVLLLATAAAADYKDGPTIQLGRYEASAVSVIVSFIPLATTTDILDRSMPSGFEIETLSTTTGVVLPARQFADLKSFTGSDYSHGIVTFAEGSSIEAAIEELRLSPLVAEVSPNYLHHTSFTPNDPYYNQYQLNLRQIYLPQAWDLSTGQGAVVAVIDTGFRTSGMSDSPKNLLTGYDFWGGDSNPNDFIGHGTHVSNTVAERTDNGIGCAGAAFNARILPCKVFPDYDAGAYEGDIIDAINWAVDQGADVINMSLGGGGYVGQTKTAINNAVDNECLVFVASGNDGERDVDYPARYDEAIAVGATNQHSVGESPRRSSFSNYGPGLDITAPGANIVQETFNGSSVGFYGAYGTSSASPHAAAVGALLVARGGADALAIRAAIESTARSPQGTWTDSLGWGEIDAHAALMNYGGASANNDKPVARATAFPATGAVPLDVFFDGSDSFDPDGQIVTYLWTWEGKVLSHDQTFDYSFSEMGNHPITLRVTDDIGAIDSDVVTVTVSSEDSDPCFQLTNNIWDGCDSEIVGPGDEVFAQEDAMTDCKQGGAAWDCLLECLDHANVDDCGSYRQCANDRCDVEVIYTPDDVAEDDDSFLCGICG
jgi:serine protease